jgi:hypothetical protein
MLNKQDEQVIEKVIKNVVIYYELGRIIVIDLNTKKCKRLAIIDKDVEGQNLKTVYTKVNEKGLEIVIDKLLKLAKGSPDNLAANLIIYYKNGTMNIESNKDLVIEITYKDLIFNFTNFNKEDCVKIIDYLGYKLGDPVKRLFIRNY